MLGVDVMELKGFYRRRAELEREARALGRLCGEDFSFLETIFVLGGENAFSLLDFLHGYCDIFARRLHDVFGYEVRNVFTNGGRLIHSYCVNGAGEYIDVRGKTSDVREFFGEFEDDVDVDFLYEYPSDNRFAVLKNDWDWQVYRLADDVMKKWLPYYA